MHVLTVVGTRPEIIRLSRIIPKLDRHVEHTLVHTGQNYSENLSGVFFQELGVRDPDLFMGVDTSSFGRQLATLFGGFETILDEIRPDRVLILGDTNSALVAYNCKRRGIPVYHMEAGNRCYDDRVPEEVNRRVIDHCSAVLLPYTERSAENLVREGIERHRIYVTGNPIHEVLSTYSQQIDDADALEKHGVAPGAYLVATMHRAENVDNPEVLASLCTALAEVARIAGRPLLLSVHPRTKQRLPEGVFSGAPVVTMDALPFFEFVKLQKHAALVLTDSGTVQEECSLFRVPVLTIRDTTERPETVECGSNLIATTNHARIVEGARFLLESETRNGWTPPAEYLEANVSDKVIRILLGSRPVAGRG
jgi:UDP-N-acetylglucosamine 2-epimerase (non-hydrolysing)